MSSTSREWDTPGMWTSSAADTKPDPPNSVLRLEYKSQAGLSTPNEPLDPFQRDWQGLDNYL